MGWQDRDYYRSSGYDTSRFGRFSAWSVTTWLIVINIAVFLLDQLLGAVLHYRQFSFFDGPLSAWGYFSADAAIYHLQLWRFITFQFLHANLGHIFFNMLALYFFGPMVEAYLGGKRYLAFYLLCGMAGAAMYMLLLVLVPSLLAAGPGTPLVGASAGIFGVLIAGARVAPDSVVMLLFPPIPMRLRTLAYILLGIAAYTVLFQGDNAGGQAAHLGGAALGWFLIYNPRLLDLFQFKLRRPRVHMRMHHDDYWPQP